TLSNSTWKAEEQSLPRDITVGLGGTGRIDSTDSQIDSENFILGGSAGASGEVHLSEGHLTVANALQIGNAGSGNLTAANEAFISAYGVTIGTLAGSTGQVSLTDSTLTSTEDIVVGLAGAGSLEGDGAHIEARNLFVGRNGGVTATVVLSGGNLTLSGEVHVGAGGDGTFTLEDGGTMKTDRGNMAFEVGSTGVLNILDGEWTNTQAIFVGVSGNGTLNIGAQGAITSESGYIAQDAVGIGTVNLTGGTWTMSNTLAVGVNGTAQFVGTGGEVSSQWAQLGLNPDSIGTVTLDATTWTTDETLTIGSGGEGQFFVTNGSVVTAGSIELGAASGVTGLLEVTNSTLETVDISVGAGEGSLSLDGARINLLGGSSVIDTLLISSFDSVAVGSGGLTVDTQGGNAQIVSVLSGNGSLTKTGEGRLRLTTANAFSGGTTIEQGVLEITNDDALSEGNVSLGTGELRATGNVTLSGSLSGGIPLISVSGNQTGTFSATTGQTLTLAPMDFLLVAGSTMQAGSAGNNGTVIFAPTGAVTLTADSQIHVVAGTLQAGNEALGFMTSIASATTVAAGATLDFQDQLPNTIVRSLNGGGTVHIGSSGNSTLTVNAGDFAGNISGNGDLVKESSGTFTVSGQTSFVGSTTINAGTFLVDGSLSNGLGPVEVNAGGTLGGSGNMGTVTLSGGTVAPGSSPGTLTASNFFWESGIILFDLGADQAASDLIVTGQLQGLGSTYDFQFVDQGWTLNAAYTLINFAGTNITDPTDFRFTNDGGFDGDFSFSGNTLQFTLTAVPEPGTVGLLAIAGLLAVLRRGRNPRRQN
ncbi:MAG: autotransporter-associated beta strand repeat-containing protein, partial [Terrimicrobiaceae bacterium]